MWNCNEYVWVVGFWYICLCELMMSYWKFYVSLKKRYLLQELVNF